MSAKSSYKRIEIVTEEIFECDDINAVNLSAVTGVTPKTSSFNIRINVPKSAAMSENSEDLASCVSNLISKARMVGLQEIEKHNPLANQPTLFSQLQEPASAQ